MELLLVLVLILLLLGNNVLRVEVCGLRHGTRVGGVVCRGSVVSGVIVVGDGCDAVVVDVDPEVPSLSICIDHELDGRHLL